MLPATDARSRMMLLGSTCPWIALAVVAAPPAKPAPVSPEAKAEAVLRATPGLSPEALRARVSRLDAAWAWAEGKGLPRTPGWRETRSDRQRDLLAKAYLDSRPGHPGLTEDQVFKAFMAQGDQRRVSHVLSPTQAEAEAVLKRLQAGEALEKVAVEVSKDPSAPLNQGNLGWVRQKELVGPFGEAVFGASVGSLVGPFKSEFGWHVAKVWEVRAQQAEAFAAERPALLKQAADAQASLKRTSALETLKATYPLVPDLKVLGLDRSLAVGPNDAKLIAGRVAGATITLKALKLYLQGTLGTMGTSHALGAGTKASFMEGLADGYRLAAAARKQGLDRQPAVQADLWHLDRTLAREHFTEAFLSTATLPEATLRQHHQANPDRFRGVGALRLQVLVADSKDQADEALTRIHGGQPWRAAAQQFGNAEATGDPDPGWVEVDALKAMVPPSLLQPLLQGTLNQPVGPMLGTDGYMLFNALERRPGPVLAFEACQDAVRKDYLAAAGQDLADRALDALAAEPPKDMKAKR